MLIGRRGCRTRTTTGSGNVTLGVLEVLLRIQSRQFLRSVNASNDYSYFDSPRSGAPITNSTNVVPRIAVPNIRIPGYLDGLLVWGAVPVPVRPHPFLPPPSLSLPPSLHRTRANSLPLSLPFPPSIAVGLPLSLFLPPSSIAVELPLSLSLPPSFSLLPSLHPVLTMIIQARQP